MWQGVLNALSYLWLLVCGYLGWMDRVPILSFLYRHCNTAVFLNLGVPVVTSFLLKRKKVVELSLVEVGKVVIVGDKKKAFKLMNKQINELRFGTTFGLKKINMFDQGTIWNTNIHKWYATRNLFNQSVTANHLQKAVEIAQSACMSFDERVRKCQGIKMDMLDEFRRITMEITCKLMFGSAYIGVDSDEMISAIVDYFKAWEYFLLRPAYFTTKAAKAHEESVRKVNGLATKIADYILENDDLDMAVIGSFRKALVDGFKENKLTKGDMVQCIIEMLLAGSDTSSVSMYYTMICLIENPCCENEMLIEFKKISNSSLHDYLSNTKETELNYLSKVFVEAMRIKPVGPVIMRRASAKFEKYDEGTNFIFDLNFMNLDDKNYTNPKCFDPHRTGLKTMFPFGIGAKSCAGRHLARVEMQTIFYHLFTKYRFGYMDGKVEAINEVETHWDIANQPCTTKLFWVIPRSRIQYIFISGCHSVGKTTLIANIMNKSFAYHFRSSGKELGRTVLDELGLNRDELNNTTTRRTYQKKLMERQVKLLEEEESEGSKEQIVLFDRSPIDNLVYSKVFSGDELYEDVHSMLSQEVLKTLKNDEQCLHIIINPTNECHKDDGTRMVSKFEDLEKFTSEMKVIMNQLGIKYVEITSIDDRVGQFLQLLSDGSF